MTTRRRCFLLGTFLSLSLFLTLRASSAPHNPAESLQVDESGLRLHMLPKPEIELPLVNTSGRPLNGALLIELIDPPDVAPFGTAASGKVEYSASETIQAEPGATVQKIALDGRRLSQWRFSRLGLFLLRYTIRAAPGFSYPSVQGVVQSGVVMRDTFQLSISAPGHCPHGARYPVSVRVVDPTSSKPRSQVRVDLELFLRGDLKRPARTGPVARQVETDALGYAGAVLELPADPSLIGGYITAQTTIGDFHESRSIRFGFDDLSRLTLTTDKPLYQPGQTLHMRALALGPDRRSRQNTGITFKITDGNGAEHFRATVPTSKFGVAGADWQVPEQGALGDYHLRAETASGSMPADRYFGTAAETSVRVSQYDLPSFIVNASPDRPYYLPGQDATVQVSANYLTGQPVLRATVRLELDQDGTIVGEFDRTGKFTARIKRERAPWKLDPSQEARFWDPRFRAFVTDESTGRTEEGRVEIRRTPQPIHIYFFTMSDSPDWTYRPDFRLDSLTSSYHHILRESPFQLYVFTCYADGAPASVNGTVEAERPTNDGVFAGEPDPAHRARLARFHTNRYGVARVELPPLDEGLIAVNRISGERLGYLERPGGWASEPACDDFSIYRKDPEPERWARLLLRVGDSQGRHGAYYEKIRVQQAHPFLRVHTDRTLYHPGDPIQITVSSTSALGDAVVNISAEDGLVLSQMAHLDHGKARLTVPYTRRLRGSVEIIAIALKKPQVLASGKVEVIYPSSRELKVGVQLHQASAQSEQTSFEPGQTVAADVTVSRPDGRAEQDDIGVVVFDRAVEERSRESNPSGRDYGFSLSDYVDSRYQDSIAGFSYRDLLNLDAARPFPEGLDLLAEAILRSSANVGYRTLPVDLPYSEPDVEWTPLVVMPMVQESLRPLINVVNGLVYGPTPGYPASESEFVAALNDFGIDLNSLKDPWGVPYSAVFSHLGVLDQFRLVSNGPDKQPGTADDFNAIDIRWPRFAPIGRAIDTALVDHHTRTSGYIRDYATLKAELAPRNIDLDQLRDPWGSPYRYSFDTEGRWYTISVDSPGPNKKFERPGDQLRDDVNIWSASIVYPQPEIEDFNRTIQESARAGKFPRNDAELKEVLAAAGLGPERLVDPAGHPYQFSVGTGTEYGNSTRPQQDAPGSPDQTTPVTCQAVYIRVSGHAGPSQYEIEKFRKVLWEQSSKDQRPVPTPTEPASLELGGGPQPSDPSTAKMRLAKPRTVPFSEIGGQQQDTLGEGVIAGKVTNIFGASVTAISTRTGRRYYTTTDRTGTYRFSNLPEGTYSIEFYTARDTPLVVTQVPVRPGHASLVDANMKGGSCLAMHMMYDLMNVAASGISASSISLNRYAQREGQASAKPLFTPRVRRFFPETLVWRPEVLTDEQGRAHISFPMADSLTTWKMSILASNAEGQVGVAEQELRSFQPFFIEHDPPRVLTQGDRVDLPVIFRNYSKKAQLVQAEMAPEPWFSAESARPQTVTIPPGRDAIASFSFHADSTVRHGKQRVTARNSETGDAVEREVLVHPDGQRISFSSASLLAGQDNSLRIDIPSGIIAGSNDTELRIYPNLVAHVLDAAIALGRVPSGCTEPIASKAYVSLMTLKILRNAGQDNDGAQNPRATLFVQCKTTLQLWCEALARGQNADGGLAGWRRASDAASTAYVVRLLTEAQDFVAVDQAVIARAARYLASQQTRSGAWLRHDPRLDEDVEDPNLSAFAARSLPVAITSSLEGGDELDRSFKLAMSYLESSIGSWNDAYLVGNYAIAAATSGRTEYIGRARGFLSSLAHAEGATTYWNLEANTAPLDGWGKAGRLETTALAVQALSMLQQTSAPDPKAVEQIHRGLQYLLSHKDGHAAWYSTRATAGVLEAIVAAMPASKEDAGAQRATVMVNGRSVSTVNLPPANEVVGPITVELSDHLQKGANSVQVVRTGNTSPTNVTALTSYYLAWSDSKRNAGEDFLPGDTRALRLKVRYDSSDIRVGQWVNCQVEVERVGFQGYGVMQAEIGLPPGADVDMKSSAGSAEVQPDRVVFYVRAEPGGSKFDFRFRVRYPIEALTAPSVLYDYYNPESNAVLAPVRFRAH